MAWPRTVVLPEVGPAKSGDWQGAGEFIRGWRAAGREVGLRRLEPRSLGCPPEAGIVTAGRTAVPSISYPVSPAAVTFTAIRGLHLQTLLYLAKHGRSA